MTSSLGALTVSPRGVLACAMQAVSQVLWSSGGRRTDEDEGEREDAWQGQERGLIRADCIGRRFWIENGEYVANSMM
ncbi:hypothetical protein BD311DRAFT_399419 [Dichomitus squalens]|uniref:Uncharacterized protein n=1 Tax=Dichomitus squalens TaxID=114155 RepID=A0A4Q9N268_9APHY|nr:hypothetical protein BD311DRAFT_399419 [Dichomitus squalens]